MNPSGISVSEKRRRLMNKKIKKQETLTRQQVNRWKRRTREKIKREREIEKDSQDVKCLLWKDIILHGDIYLGRENHANNKSRIS